MGVPTSPIDAVSQAAGATKPNASVTSWWEAQDFVTSMLAFAGGPSAAPCVAASCKALNKAVDASWEELTNRFPMRLHVVGGLNSNFDAIASAWRLTHGCGAWEALPDLPVARAGPAAVLLQGQLYVMGGELCGDAAQEVYRLTHDGSKWEVVAPMNQARIRPGVVACGGFIYVFGGTDGANTLKSAERYNPLTGMWEQLPEMHRPRYACAAAARPGDCVLAFGGELTEQGAAASLEMFDPTTAAWELLPSVRTPSCGSAVGVIGAGRLAFAVGGLGLSGQALPLAEGMMLGQALETGSARFQAPTWGALPPMPTPRHLASAAGFGAGAVVVGGKGPTFEATSNVDVFKPEAAVWESLPALPEPRLRVAVASGRC